MILTLVLFIIVSLVRAIISTQFNVSTLWGAHIWFLLPDIAFFLFLNYWLFVKEQKKPTLSLVLFLVAFLGSIIWDYQDGFYVLKLLVFPGLLYVILNTEHFNTANLGNLVLYSFPIFQNPFTSLKKFFSEFFTSKHEVDPDSEEHFSLSKAIWFGIGLGAILLMVLSALDHDFADFLQIARWSEIFFNTIGSLIYYGFVFFWYFWKPVHTKWEGTVTVTSLSALLHRAVVMVVGIMIGYTFYDTYIILRVFKLLKLTFETIGLNTQLNFLELVILGGGWLFLVVYLLNKLKDKEQTKRVHTIFMLLLVSSLWLIPPVLNILRVLFTVYIPQFGPSARRLFGIYTTFAFLIAMLTIFFGVYKKQSALFSQVVITFFVTLVLLSFTVPTNLIIANWHVTRYLDNDPAADFKYYQKIKLQKWGWYLDQYLQDEQHPTSLLWKLSLAKQTGDEEKQKEYKQMLKDQVKTELVDMREHIGFARFDDFLKKYSDNSYWRLQKQLSVQGMHYVDFEEREDEAVRYAQERLDYENFLNETDTFTLQLRPSYLYIPNSKMIRRGNEVLPPNGIPAKEEIIWMKFNTSKNTDTLFSLDTKFPQNWPYWKKDLVKECGSQVIDGSCISMGFLCDQYVTNYNQELTFPEIPPRLVEKELEATFDNTLCR